jgi:hypothetical protein
MSPTTLLRARYQKYRRLGAHLESHATLAPRSTTGRAIARRPTPRRSIAKPRAVR